jgi:hypothetical protein
MSQDLTSEYFLFLHDIISRTIDELLEEETYEDIRPA